MIFKDVVFLTLKAPLLTPVTADKFAYLTEKRRLPIPILPGKYTFLTTTTVGANFLAEHFCKQRVYFHNPLE